MKSSQKFKDIAVKKQLRLYIKTTLSSLDNSSVLPQELQLVLNSNKHIFIRIVWLILMICCSIIFFYQVYDRIKHFIGKPIAVDVFVNENDTIEIKPFYVTNVDTDEFNVYWGNESREAAKCYVPIQTVFEYFPSVVKNINLTKFWLDTNSTFGLEKIQLTYGSKTETDEFCGGVRVNSSKSVFIVSEKINIYGWGTFVSKKEKIKMGSQVSMYMRKKGECITQLPMFFFDDLTPHRLFYFLRFGGINSFKQVTKQFNFVATTDNPCVSQKEVEKCYRACLLEKFNELPCRFPFTPQEIDKMDCNYIENLDDLRKFYIRYQTVEKETSPTADCKCIRPCSQFIYQIVSETEEMNNTELSIVRIHYTDRHSLIFTEKFAYGGVNLVTDIAGNMGLFLGLSLLSIIQLKILAISNFFQKIYKNCSIQKQKKLKLNNCIRNKIEDNVFSMRKLTIKRDDLKLNQSVNIPLLLFSFGIIILLLIASVLMIHDRVVYLLSNPVRKVVELKDHEKVYQPNCILCGEGLRYSMMKKKMAEKKNIPKCEIHFLQFIDWKKMSVVKLWKTLEIYYFDEGVKLMAKFSGRSPDRLSGTKTTTPMLHGDCFEFTFEPQAYYGVIGSYTMFAREGNTDECNSGLYQMYFRPYGAKLHSILKSQRNVSPSRLVIITVRTVVIKRQKTSTFNCDNDPSNFEKCKNNCYDKKINETIKCKLPFMESVNQSWCDTTQTATESLNAYKNIILLTNIHKEDCNCLLPCKETIFQTYAYFNLPEVVSYSQRTHPESNLVENIIEVLSYDIVALLCDVGNSFGLTLGLSLLSLFQGTINLSETSIIYLKEKLNK